MIQVGTYEANIVRHCNNRCASCSHGSPWAKHYVMPVGQLFADLCALARYSHAKQFWLLGGEPLLHPELLDMIEAARMSKVSDEVNVLTNGSLLPSVPEEFWSKINFLRISVYSKLNPKCVELARKKSDKYGFQLGLDGIQTFVRQFAYHPNRETFNGCGWKARCWTVHHGYLFLCPNAAFFPNQFMGLPDGIDGLPLDSSLTEQKLDGYLHHLKIPYHACEICEPFTASSAWHECKSKAEWVRDSMVRPGEVIPCLEEWAKK